MQLVLLFVVLATLEAALSARLLAILPLAARSHHAFFQPILKALALRGHDVTVYSPFPQPTARTNYTDVYLDTPLNDESTMNSAFWNFIKASQISMDKTIWDTVYQTTEVTFNQEPIKQLMNSSEHFDLVITQALVGQESMLAFGHKFQAPTIVLQPKSACTVDNLISGNSLSLSYIPDVGLSFSSDMSFLQRLLNSFSKLSTLYHHHFYQIPRQEALLRKYFPDPSRPPLVDLVYNVSLMFTLGHVTGGYAQPNTPNIIPLGGIHVETQRKPLPLNIKRFMDEAKHGVIYFSLGTYVPDDLMAREYFRNYINVFKRLPQRVLWKTRAEGLEDLPANVMTGKWLPQQDILAHPKCVLFITHGGLLSQHEAMHFGVPVVGVPYFADQPMNVRFYEHAGLGVGLDHKRLTEHSIYESITKVLGDPRFSKNAKRVSQIFRDREVTPASSVVYWTEYVLRHGGAPHLRPASSQIPWFQRFLVDIVVVVLAVIFLALLVAYTFLRHMYGFIVKSTLIKAKRKSKMS